MNPALLWMMACKSCVPDLPPPDDEETNSDSGDSADSGETGDTADTGETGETGPPPLCEVEEIEPNEFTSMQTVPTETYVCGIFNDAEDDDWFAFSQDEEGWMRVEVQAASRGSNANPRIDLYAVGQDDATHSTSSYLTSDVAIIFPAEPDSYWVDLQETDKLYGEDYNYYFIASSTKPPVTWTGQESEPNDDFGAGNSFTFGDTIFGWISDPGDSDWYELDVPENVDYLVFTVSAYKYGSVADINLRLYQAEDDDVWLDYGGASDYDPDPFHEWKDPAAGHYSLKLYQSNQASGSMFHWYTLNIEAIMKTDTGSIDSDTP